MRAIHILLLVIAMALPSIATPAAAQSQTVLYTFCSRANCADGDSPYYPLALNNAGVLFGSTLFGGQSPLCTGGNCGTIFSLTPPQTAGGNWTLSTYSLEGGAHGTIPLSTLLPDGAGAFYGTTAGGGNLSGPCTSTGNDGCGTVFKVTPPPQPGRRWEFLTLHKFSSTTGNLPIFGVISYGGNYFGTASGGGHNNRGTVYELTPPPPGSTHWTQTTLYQFCSQALCADGADPEVNGLVADSNGVLYGMTLTGGTGNGGTVFMLSPPAVPGGAWTETVLYNFCSQPDCADGVSPVGGLLRAGNGVLYGTTSGGGSTGATSSAGTVFSLTPPQNAGGAWTHTVLYNFCAGLTTCTDGSDPQAGLIADANGALYGTTVLGGTGANGGVGTAFKLTPPANPGGAWSQSVLWNFCSQTNCSDGIYPRSALIGDQAGNLYGTASEGPSNGGGISGNGAGLVFKLTGTGFSP